MRYRSFEDELYLYCYRVAGTVALMTIPVLGTAGGATFDEAVGPGVALGVALQVGCSSVPLANANARCEAKPLHRRAPFGFAFQVLLTKTLNPKP